MKAGLVWACLFSVFGWVLRVRYVLLGSLLDVCISGDLFWFDGFSLWFTLGLIVSVGFIDV